jgi:hypothetical protein
LFHFKKKSHSGKTHTESLNDFLFRETKNIKIVDNFSCVLIFERGSMNLLFGEHSKLRSMAAKVLVWRRHFAAAMSLWNAFDVAASLYIICSCRPCSEVP